MSGLQIAFGTGSFGRGSWADPKDIEELYAVLEQEGVKKLDTARLYGASESVIGQTGGSKRFAIDSKTPGGFAQYEPGSISRADILQHVKDSVERTGASKLDIFYIHAPDPAIELADLLGGIQDAYEAGLFTRFGLSNYQAEQVQQVHDLCKEKGYVLPTVYQGNYSAVARRQETELFPTLKKLGMGFYVYSPLAGGFLTKTKEKLLEGSEVGRFEEGGLYGGLYRKPALLSALKMWEEAAESAGVSRAELGYRWVAFNSELKGEGNGIIIGASSVAQAKQTLGWLKKGPLDAAATAKIDEIWKTIEHEAPLDNYHGRM